MAVRVAVLRKDTPTKHCAYPEDSLDDVVHLGIRRDGIVVATSTWFTKDCPEVPGVAATQLKGMAVDESLHNSGYGALLVTAGCELAHRRNSEIVWARARDSALGFYEKCGFNVVGEGFIDEPTAMPHHIVVKYL